MAGDVTHWLYPTNERSRYRLVDPETRQETQVAPEELLPQIEAHPYREDAWYLSSGYRTMRHGDAVWLYAAGRQEIYALGRAARIRQDDREAWHVDLVWDLPSTRSLIGEPIQRGVFHQIPQSVCRADSTTRRVLSKWLRDKQFTVTDWDADDEAASPGDARTRVLAAIVRRQGQPKFRQQLLMAYGGRCAVTGETAEAVLEAAHIEPYMGRHSNVVGNGLLLRADLHTLLDLHLIGVGADSRLVVSRRLDKTSYVRMSGQSLHLPTSARARPSKRRLAVHLRGLI